MHDLPPPVACGYVAGWYPIALLSGYSQCAVVLASDVRGARRREAGR